MPKFIRTILIFAMFGVPSYWFESLSANFRAQYPITGIICNIVAFVVFLVSCLWFYEAFLADNKKPIPATPISPYPPMPQMPRNEDSEYGSANWENPECIDDLFNGGGHKIIESEGYYIGAGYCLEPLVNAVCVAGSGQGKGTCLILPNLLRKPTASYFILDPKGENAFISALWQRRAGQKVYIIDPWGEQERMGATHGVYPSGFNPLAFIKNTPREVPESCGVIADMLVPDTGNSNEDFWNGRARTLIKTYLLHLVTERPKEEQHLGTIYKWLRLSVMDDDRPDVVTRPKLWIEMRANESYGGLIQDGINQFYGMSDDSGPLPSIIQTAQHNTEFLESEALRESLSKSDFNPQELTNGKTTVYVCLPERFLDSHKRWLRLVVGVCLKVCNFKYDKRVNFMLDEFAILGQMTDVERAFAYGRGQNISVWIFVQSLTQLISVYGQHRANAFLANARLRQFFGIFDLDTQKYLSEYLGDTTIKIITKSQSETRSNSSGKSSGWSTSENADFFARNNERQSSSGGDSSGQSWSSSTSTNEQKIGRKLMTNEEIGKLDHIITLIDGHKFMITRLAFWESYLEAFEKGIHKYYPLALSDWHGWINTLKRDRSKVWDIMNVLGRRAQGKKVNINKEGKT